MNLLQRVNENENAIQKLFALGDDRFGQVMVRIEQIEDILGLNSNPTPGRAVTAVGGVASEPKEVRNTGPFYQALLDYSEPDHRLDRLTSVLESLVLRLGPAADRAEQAGSAKAGPARKRDRSKEQRRAPREAAAAPPVPEVAEAVGADPRRRPRKR